MALNEVVAHPLPDDILPTEIQIYQHYLYLLEVKSESGEWNNFTPLEEKVKILISDVAAQWDKTGIPHDLSEKRGRLRIESVISRIRKLKGRDEKILEKFQNLCDVARCKCTNHCNCILEDQVPSAWKEFLADQRRERKLSLRKFSLRGATEKSESERKRRLEKEELLAKKQKFEQRCRTELEEQFETIGLEEIEGNLRILHTLSIASL